MWVKLGRAGCLRPLFDLHSNMCLKTGQGTVARGIHGPDQTGQAYLSPTRIEIYRNFVAQAPQRSSLPETCQTRAHPFCQWAWVALLDYYYLIWAGPNIKWSQILDPSPSHVLKPKSPIRPKVGWDQVGLELPRPMKTLNGSHVGFSSGGSHFVDGGYWNSGTLTCEKGALKTCKWEWRYIINEDSF